MEFIKKYWSSIILFVVIIILSIWIFSLKKDLNDRENLIYVTDTITVIDSTRYSTLMAEYQNLQSAFADLERKNKSLYNIIKDNEEEISSYISIVLKLKEQIKEHITDTVFVVNNDTILVPIGDDKVYINEETGIVKVTGYTYLHPKKGYIIKIEGKDIILDVVITEDANGVYKAYIDTQNPELELIKFVPRFVGKDKTDDSFWDNIGGMVGMNMTNQNLFLDAGITYHGTGLKAIFGYQYDNINNSKGKFYGMGMFINF